MDAARAYSDGIDKTLAGPSNPCATSGSDAPAPGAGSRAREGVKQCGTFALVAACGDCGDLFRRKLHCGREWCPTCGEKRSETHLQRVARWLPKVQQISRMGYWVIEFDTATRAQYRSQDALREFGRQVVAVFKRYGYKRGLRRWHWFGDKAPAKIGYNPHLNVLTDATLPWHATEDTTEPWAKNRRGEVIPGRIHPHMLEQIKAALREATGLAVAEGERERLIIRYEPRPTIPQMLHCLRYVTRATFRNVDWDPAMADELIGFRTTDQWGTQHWQQEQPAWDLEAREQVDITPAARALMENRCPCCGGEVRWRPGLVLESHLTVMQDLGCGFAQITEPPDVLVFRPDRARKRKPKHKRRKAKR